MASLRDMVGRLGAVVGAALGVALLTLAGSLGFLLAAVQPHLVSTLHARSDVRLLHQSMLDRETGLRGYLLTGQTGYLQPWNDAQRSFAALRADLQGRLPASDTGPLLAAEDGWLAWSQPIAAHSPRPAGPELTAELDAGKALFDGYRAVADPLQARLDGEVASLQAEQNRVLETAAVVGCLLLLLLGWAALRRVRHVRRVIAEPLEVMLADLEAFPAGGHFRAPPPLAPDELASIGRGLIAMERELQLATGALTLAFDRAAWGLAMLDLDRTIRRVNGAFGRLVGHAPEELAGQRCDDVLPARLVEGLSRFGTGRDPLREFSAEFPISRQDGTTRWVLLSAAAVDDDRGEPLAIFCQAQDITGRKHQEQDLLQRAMYDELTGTLNRQAVLERIEAALAGLPGEPAVGLVFIDLDGFKAVNDALGHAAGDALLAEVALRLRAAVRPDDLVARLGGDEFVVLARGLAERDLLGLAARLSEAVAEPVAVAGTVVTPAISVGCAVADEPGRTATGLLGEADERMYEHKRRLDRLPVPREPAGDPVAGEPVAGEL